MYTTDDVYERRCIRETMHGKTSRFKTLRVYAGIGPVRSYFSWLVVLAID